ncbi:MAG: TM2 domain-containing protein [Luteolibacter sp.]|jgi:TM2 domain-containing membrane protein YozV
MSNEPEQMPDSPQTPPTAEEPTTPAPPPVAPAPGGQIPGAEKKIVAGILGILIGGLGVHKFYLGYTKEGVIQLVAGLVIAIATCGMGAIVPWAVGLVEGIIYLTKTDEDFVKTYVTGRKAWF